MSDTLYDGPALRLADALEVLVARGTITAEQQAAILAEVAAPPSIPARAAGAGAAESPRVPGPARHRRSLAEVLIEVGLYVGSALVLAAAVVLVAQNWEGFAQSTRIAILGAAALVTGVVGFGLARGAPLGTARRRLAGVVLVGTAVSAAGTVALLLGDRTSTAVAAVATALVVMVVAHLRASSIITELGIFVASYALLQVTAEWLRPETVAQLDEYGNEYYEASTFDRMTQFGGYVFGLCWALLVARRLLHRELAVGLGVAVAFMSALPLAGDQPTRAFGLVAMALLAAVGFWRFMAEGHWPWLAGAIASVTAFVFWLVGGAQQPALAILAAGLVMLGSSALGMWVARRRKVLAAGKPPLT